ncbi:MAG: PaaI family thioesterase [Betaproteobacteria bacterium]|nr:MAG: PaaI family thioesterase [Betaproteobacteria bacterium]
MAQAFQAVDPNFEARVRDSFARQGAMRLIGAGMTRIEPGYCEIELPYREDLTQQHGLFHGGFVSAIADTAGGYAAYSLFPAEDSILTVEYKINLLAPGAGDKLVASARVKKTGKTLTVCELEVLAMKRDGQTLCACGLATLIRLAGRADRPRAE